MAVANQDVLDKYACAPCFVVSVDARNEKELAVGVCELRDECDRADRGKMLLGCRLVLRSWSHFLIY
jgi:hypothetical protein